MPIEIIDLDEGRGNVIIGSGILTGEEYIDELKGHLAQDEEKLKSYLYSLTDYTAVTMVEEAPTSVIRLSSELCKRAEAINPDVIVAIVADNDLLFGLSRMWEILMDTTGWETKVFKARETAEMWIAKRLKERFGAEHLAFGST